MSEHTLYLDIETLPAPESAMADIEVSPPGNMKKPETIEKWWREEGEAKRHELWERTALDGSAGRIAVVGWALDDDEVCAASGLASDERELIRDILDEIEVAIPYGPNEICAHFAAFDLGFLRKRCIVHGIRLPMWFPKDLKPWSPRIRCTQYLWSGDARETIGLGRLCRALGIPDDDTVTGADVARLWAAGDHESVIGHCKSDVAKVREVDRRLRAAGI